MGRKQPYLPAAQNNSKVLHICPYALNSMHNFRVKGSYLENYVQEHIKIGDKMEQIP